MPLLRSAASVATAFIVAWAAAHFLARDEAVPRAPLRDAVVVGSTLPDAVIHFEDGRVQGLRAVLAGAPLSALVLFSTQCSSCAGEAIVWRELADLYHSRVALLAIATTPDVGFVRAIAQETERTFMIARAGMELPKALGAPGLPTIYVADSAGMVRFLAAGTSATAELREWLGKKLSSKREAESIRRR